MAMNDRQCDGVARLVAARVTRRGLATGLTGGLFGGGGGGPAATRPAGLLATFELGGQRFRLVALDPRTIAQLRRLRREQPIEDVPFPIGPIRRGPGARRHNAPWGWHFDPVQVVLTEAATEVCDAEPSYVEDHIDEFIRIGRYCPWGARLVALRPFRPERRRARRCEDRDDDEGGRGGAGEAAVAASLFA
jgi:hypothetical protein